MKRLLILLVMAAAVLATAAPASQVVSGLVRRLLSPLRLFGLLRFLLPPEVWGKLLSPLLLSVGLCLGLSQLVLLRLRLPRLWDLLLVAVMPRSQDVRAFANRIGLSPRIDGVFCLRCGRAANRLVRVSCGPWCLGRSLIFKLYGGIL